MAHDTMTHDTMSPTWTPYWPPRDLCSSALIAPSCRAVLSHRCYGWFTFTTPFRALAAFA
jgi:hypothetical protein